MSVTTAEEVAEWNFSISPFQKAIFCGSWCRVTYAGLLAVPSAFIPIGRSTRISRAAFPPPSLIPTTKTHWAAGPRDSRRLYFNLRRCFNNVCGMWSHHKSL